MRRGNAVRRRLDKENTMADLEFEHDWNSMLINTKTSEAEYEGLVVMTDQTQTTIMVTHPSHIDPKAPVEGTIEGNRIWFQITLNDGKTKRNYDGRITVFDGQPTFPAVIIGEYHKVKQPLPDTNSAVQNPSKANNQAKDLLTEDDGGWVAIRPPGA
jgi:hypothetical protein